jgi:N-succinyl-L-ornithine transcarbamylase
MKHHPIKHFTSVKDVPDIREWVNIARSFKANPMQFADAGKHKTIALIFLNPSLRTRLSTQKAAMNLGMQAMVMNSDKEGWALEYTDGNIMNGSTVEHIKDAAGALGKFADIIGVRCFPSLTDKEKDDSEFVLNKFIEYSGVPVVSLESSTLHPLQSFADLITIDENWKKTDRPKVVLTWAPHVKALPQAVPNSFAEWMCKADVDFTITHPEGLELNEKFTSGATINTNQIEALEGADFIYVKNWSSYQEYGKPYLDGSNWFLGDQQMNVCPGAKIMHCLPVRRNVELSDALLDGPGTLVMQQAENRTYAAQTVLWKMLQAHV